MFFEGNYTKVYIYTNIDPWIKRNAASIAQIIEDYVKKTTNILNINLRCKVNVTIVPLLTIGKKLGMGKGWGMARQPFLITDTGVIVGYAPYNIRSKPYFIRDKNVINMSYLMLIIADSVNIYLIWNYISYPYSYSSFGFFEALNLYMYLHGIPAQYRVETTLIKWPHGFTASMINIGYYKPLKFVIENFRYGRPYGWEIFSFGN